GVSEEKLREAVEDNARTRRYRRVCFTGGEVTLEKKLFDYIAIVRESKSFEHVRVQTNGRLLSDMAFARRMVAAGVDEFFVSLHGHDATTQDYISQRSGSFDEALRGIANLAELGVCLMTNTVINSINVAHLADIVDTVGIFRPVRMEFWNYLPMEDYADERSLLAPMSQVAPEIRRALARIKDLGFEGRVKYVPRCMLGEFADAHDDSQPDVVIAEKFYDPYPQFACIYEAKCEHSETCLGLHHPYITKFGWEESALSPTPRTRLFVEPDDGPWIGSDMPGQGMAVSLEHPEWRALVDGVAEAHEARLTDVRLTRRTCNFTFRHGHSDAESSVEIVLTARDEAAPALARTPSFNIHYRAVSGPSRELLASVVRDSVRAIRAHDGGSMKLDRRKGLIGSEALRRRAGGGSS
ncbi:MAG: radical domain protein, partial [Myxococcaceae bacterium]|nr:radical domain protein [Myxococcaceae bacterium]